MSALYLAENGHSYLSNCPVGFIKFLFASKQNEGNKNEELLKTDTSIFVVYSLA